jgi:hypothetical protein
MKTRILFAALSAVLIGAAAAPAQAQPTPEQSAAAKAAPQAPSEQATASSSLRATPAPKIRSFAAERSTESGGGKADLATAAAKPSN